MCSVRFISRGIPLLGIIRGCRGCVYSLGVFLFFVPVTVTGKYSKGAE